MGKYIYISIYNTLKWFNENSWTLQLNGRKFHIWSQSSAICKKGSDTSGAQRKVEKKRIEIII